MRLGVDYSTRSNNWPAFAKALKAKKRTYVGRYLASNVARIPRDTRALSKAEAEALAAAGIDIFVWWENSPDHVGSHTIRRALDGRLAGVQDAKEAAAMMVYFGQPTKPIFFTVDYDLSYTAVRAYFEGAMSVVGFDRMAVYGGYSVVEGLLKNRIVKYACQTDAWRYGRGWYPGAQLHQWTHGSGYAGNINGIECDGLEAVVEDFGQWRYGQTVPEIGDDGMTPEQAEKLIESSAKNGYRSAIAAALEIGWTDEVKRLNDEFYERWPRQDKYSNIINSSGLPVVWPVP